MKIFIVAAALLVASAAGQSLDVLKLKEPLTSFSKFNRPLTTPDFLGRRLLGHPLERSLIYGQNIEVPTYLQDEILDVNVLQLEEVMSHPLFRIYINLPLFRQYWSYPMFQRYITSVYFQRFWHLPSFQQYFINPVLFYKYIYPLVTLFKYDTTSTTFNPITSGDYAWNKDYYNTYPYNYNYNYGRQQQYDNIFVPSTSYRTGVHDQVYYKYLIDRLYNHLNMQQNRVNEINTDVQFTPEETVEEQTVGQIVEPTFTNDVDFNLPVEDTKVVDQEFVPIPEQQINFYPTIRQFNPFVARMLQRYDYNRVFPMPIYNRY